MMIPPMPVVIEHEGITPIQRAKQMFVIKILMMTKVDVKEWQDMSKAAGRRLEHVKAMMERGKIANKGNPWSESTKRRDKLRKSLGYWWAIGADRTTLGWIGFGVKLTFEARVPRRAFNNHASYTEEVEHIRKEHEIHEADGSFEEVEEDDVMVGNPLQVEVNPKGKRRTCTDGRYINAFLADMSFTQETLNKHVAQIVEPNMMMITTDVAKAYYQVPLHKESQGYCGWRHDGKWFRPTILIFGLSVAPFIFTKIMRAVLIFHRSMGIRGTNCIDDNLWAGEPHEIEEIKDIVKIVFGTLGWQFNEKCVFEADTTVLYNGMWIDSKKFEIRATDEKMNAVKKLAWKMWYSVRDGREVSVYDMQVLTGRLQSLKLAIEGVAVWTRGIYRIITKTMEKWNQRMPKGTMAMMTDGAMSDMNFFAFRLGQQNGMPIRDTVREERLVMYSDASDVGYGAHMMERTLNEEGKTEVAEVERVAGQLEEWMTSESSTAREIKGVMMAAEKMKERLRGKKVLIIMDSYPAIRNFINGGGRIELLSTMVKEWWMWCRKNKVYPLYEWRAREENTLADELSKIAAESHTIIPEVERRVRQWLDSIGLQGTNTHQWTRIKVVAPRFNNIQVRVSEMMHARRPGCIIVPVWTGQVWWPKMVRNSTAKIELGVMEDVVSTRETNTQVWTMQAHAIIPEERDEQSDKGRKYIDETLANSMKTEEE